MITPNDLPIESVKIGSHVYKITIDGEKSEEYGDNWGVAYFRSRTINLNDRMPSSQIKLTLFHEVLHAIGDYYDIPYFAYHEWAKEYARGGDKIDMMAKAILEFIQDNKDAIVWLADSK